MNTHREAFLAGMVYAAGPRTASDIIQNEDRRADIDLILDQLGHPTNAELVAQTRRMIDEAAADRSNNWEARSAIFAGRGRA